MAEMRAEILCVGTELLLGDIVNTNAAYLAKELANIGIGVYYQSVVGDNPQRLKDAIALGFSRADLIVMTGGLGPTYDDLTKETVAHYFGKEMKLHEASLQAITAFFEKIGRRMTDNNVKQAWMPEGAEVFDNANGTAPGLAVSENGKTAILLPGPPNEMKPMFERSVLPYLQQFSDRVFVSHNVRLFGIGESTVEDLLFEQMKNSTNPTIAPYAKAGEVTLRVTASGRDSAECEERINPVLVELQDLLGEFCYGIDVPNLQTAAVQKLMECGKTVATAESCTGGLISQRITELSGSSGIFGLGVCSYANEMKEKVLGVRQETLKEHGAVSEQTAREMAQGVRAISGADIGIATTGIAGPTGGTPEKPVGLVYLAIDSDFYSTVLELHLAFGRREFDRAHIRHMSAQNAFALILKALDALGG